MYIDKYNNKTHENRITELSLWKNKKYFASCSADLSIKIWEINDCISLIHDYE